MPVPSRRRRAAEPSPRCSILPDDDVRGRQGGCPAIGPRGGGCPAARRSGGGRRDLHGWEQERAWKRRDPAGRERRPAARDAAADGRLLGQSAYKSYDEWNDPVKFDPPSLTIFRRDAKEIIIPVMDEIFEDIEYKVPKSVHPKIIELVYRALNSSFVSAFLSGVVVFGFGKKELFPSMVAHEFDGITFGRMRTVRYSSVEEVASGPTIVPFADREIMDTLIQGTSRHMERFYLQVARAASIATASRILDENLSLTADERRVGMHLITKQIDDLGTFIASACDGYVHERYVNKMIDALEDMPKEELATVAEALVEVTALRIKASEELESVSGPVDVCLVTKGDGLIWIKRKHYFDINKNLQYLYRRFGLITPIVHGGKP